MRGPAAGRAVITASAVKLAAVGPQTVDEPAGTNGLGAQLADALKEATVGGDEDDAGGSGRSLRDQGVVAIPGGVDDADTVDFSLSDAGPGGAFEDDHCR